MLWLKAWLETRWKALWMLLMGAFLVSLPALMPISAPNVNPTFPLIRELGLTALVSFIAAIMLAGSGIETTSNRPGEPAKGSEGSTLFTLSLPVSRARLFSVRTITGLLETLGLLVLFAAFAWPRSALRAVNAHDAIGTLAVLVSFSVTAYAASACLSTFCDEGWRLRGSALGFAGLFVLSFSGKVPKSINFFAPLTSASPAVTHEIPWAMIAGACVLAVLFLAAGMTIIQTRDY